jgi:hypothetical protein
MNADKRTASEKRGDKKLQGMTVGDMCRLLHKYGGYGSIHEIVLVHANGRRVSAKRNVWDFLDMEWSNCGEIE